MSMHEPEPRFAAKAKKQYGQHFLHERGFIERIVQAVRLQPGEGLVEIGPGQGAITFPLLQRFGALTAIEYDRDLIVPLGSAAKAHGQLRIIPGDVLEVDFSQLAGATEAGRICLVGNLPYNLSSPILFHALEHAAVIREMVFMLQKEVVDRMGAAPGSKVYGRLSVMLQAWCQVSPLFNVPPGAFRPPPKVDSAVVRLVPRDPADVAISDKTRFANIVRAAFGQRRKTLRNALQALLSADAIAAAGIDPQARAEQLSVAQFIQLANHSPGD